MEMRRYSKGRSVQKERQSVMEHLDGRINMNTRTPFYEALMDFRKLAKEAINIYDGEFIDPEDKQDIILFGLRPLIRNSLKLIGIDWPMDISDVQEFMQELADLQERLDDVYKALHPIREHNPYYAQGGIVTRGTSGITEYGGASIRPFGSRERVWNEGVSCIVED
jgi:hypothetical protein